MDAVLEDRDTLDPGNAAQIPRPIFFMHIAKTAGSFLNARFQAALSTDQVATHIETSVGDSVALAQALDNGVRYFSGHVMYGLWADLARPLAQDFCKIALVRDPVDHLASHIQWLDHYNLPEFTFEYRQLDEAHRRIVDRIGAVDITEIGQLDQFLDSLSGVAVRLFDNCQSRYFIANGRHTYDTMRPLTLADRFSVANAVGAFDAVVFQGDMDAALARLAQVTGVALEPSETRVNPARSDRRIDTSNPIVRQVLSRRTLLDQWLVRHIHTRGVADA